MHPSKLPPPFTQYYYSAAKGHGVLVWSNEDGWNFAIRNSEGKMVRAAYSWPTKKSIFDLVESCLLSMAKSKEVVLKQTRYVYKTPKPLTIRSSDSGWVWDIGGRMSGRSPSKTEAVAEACKVLR